MASNAAVWISEFRPTPKTDRTSPLEFQLLGMHVADDDFGGRRVDVPRVGTPAYTRFIDGGNWRSDSSSGGFSSESAQRAIVFLFGRTTDGVGVCARVRGYQPWAWFETETDHMWSRSDATSYLAAITKQQRIRQITSTGKPAVTFRLECRRRFFGYEYDGATGEARLRQHMRVATTSMRDLIRIRRGIEHEGGMHRGHVTRLIPCLSSVSPARRPGQPWMPNLQARRPDIDTPPEFVAMVELGLLPGGWVRVRGGMYNISSTSYSHCDIEIECGVPAVEPLTEDTWPAVDAPTSLLSFDIETYSSDGFPQAERTADIIIGIGCIVQWRGDVCDAPTAPAHTRTRKIYLANTAGNTKRPDAQKLPDDSGEEIREFPNELALLRGFWRLAVAELDADYVAGYNTSGFDWPYIYKRAALLTTGRADLDALDIDAPWPRGGGFMLRASKLASLQTHLSVQTATGVHTPRRLLRGEFDLLPFVRNRHKFRCLKLDYVGHELLGRGKTGITPQDMNEAWRTGDPEKLAAVAHYCIIDCDLVAEIERYDMCTDESRAFARVNRALMPFDVLASGPVVRTTRALARFGLEQKFMLSAFTPFTDQFKYEGGLVLTPQPGLYRCPVMVLDFKSLYPSIIRADRLCASTFVAGGVDAAHAAGLTDDQLHILNVAPGRQTCFRKAAQGLLPMLVEAFNDARGRTRAQQKHVDPKSRRGKQLNMKQLQEKLAANAAYGVMKQLAIHVAEAITYTGREMLKTTQRRALELVPEARVVAGDSVTGDTSLILRERCSGHVFVAPIDSLFADVQWAWRTDGKETLSLDDDVLDVWSDTGFIAIRRIIRHRTFKPIVRVVTPSGIVDCTTDHSLLRPDGITVSPNDICVGTKLMHHDPTAAFVPRHCDKITPQQAFEIATLRTHVPIEILCATDLCIVDSFWDAFCWGAGAQDDGNGNHSTCGIDKTFATELWIVASRIGLAPSIRCTGTDLVQLVWRESDDDAGDDLIACTTTTPLEFDTEPGGTTVYDLETANHHFHVGPGAMIVHNTDSIMVAFNLSWTAADIDEAFRVGDRVASEITKLFTHPKELENEGGYCPYYVDAAKKHYVCHQWLWSFSEKRAVAQTKIMAKGMDFVRREAPSIFRNTDREFFTKLIMDDDEVGAYNVMHTLVEHMFDPATRADEFDFSTGVKAIAEYKTPDKLPQVVCYRKMERRQPGSGPRSGDRLQYVIVENRNSHQLCDKYEELAYTLANPTVAKIDRRWYLQRYIDHAKKAFAGLPRVVQLLQAALLRKQGVRTLDDFVKKTTNSPSSMASKRPRIPIGDIHLATRPTPPMKRKRAHTKPTATTPTNQRRLCMRTLPHMTADGAIQSEIVTVALLTRK